MSETKRCVNVTVRWNEKDATWAVYVGGNLASSGWKKKVDAEVDARARCYSMWVRELQPCELFLYTKNGDLGKGGRARSTYGRTSRRTKRP